MGNWNINIQGVGCHHNAVLSDRPGAEFPKDAEQMAAQFVVQLAAAGHVIESATITYGSKDELIQHPAWPPAEPPK